MEPRLLAEEGHESSFEEVQTEVITQQADYGDLPDPFEEVLGG